MATKTLYLLVSNGGDGSYSINYTFDAEMIARMEEAYDNGDLEPEFTPGCDGDGFHYDTLNVPADATYESLGITYPYVFGDDA